MRKFYHKTENENISNFQELYNQVVEIGQNVNRMRGDIISFCVGFIDNKSSMNNEKNRLDCINLLRSVNDDKYDINETIDSAALYLIEQFRKTGSRMKLKKVEDGISHLSSKLVDLSKEQLSAAMNNYKLELKEKIDHINQQFEALMVNWEGDNVVEFRNQILSKINGYAKQYTEFNNNVNPEIQQEL